jgi:glycosyltransferase involved in cell wall biosynthesis
MHILILNWKDIKNPDVGGAEIILYEFAKRLVTDGHNVTWFCRKFPGCIENETINGVDVVRRGGKISVYLEAYKYYRSLKNKPDKVLDCLNTIAWQTPLYVAKEKRIFYVNQLAREVFFYELPPIISHISYILEKLQFIFYGSTKTVCYSESTKKDMESVGIPANIISIFPMGLDHDRYKPGKKSKTPFFVFVARLVSMKRADLCIRAMSYVIKNVPDARLAIIGYGPQEIYLQKLIRKLKLDYIVTIVNKNNLYFSKDMKDVKVKLLQESWVLLLPSVKEGWGMVVTEAAACGTPSIVTDVTGLRDSVINGKTGIILPYLSVGTLAKSMINLSLDTELRKEYSKNAIDNSAHYSWEKSYSVFKKLISN